MTRAAAVPVTEQSGGLGLVPRKKPSVRRRRFLRESGFGGGACTVLLCNLFPVSFFLPANWRLSRARLRREVGGDAELLSGGQKVEGFRDF